jgi:hypothetical protein
MGPGEIAGRIFFERHFVRGSAASEVGLQFRDEGVDFPDLSIVIGRHSRQTRFFKASGTRSCASISAHSHSFAMASSRVRSTTKLSRGSRFRNRAAAVSKLTADLVELSDIADQLANRSHFGATQEAARRVHSWYS